MAKTPRAAARADFFRILFLSEKNVFRDPRDQKEEEDLAGFAIMLPRLDPSPFHFIVDRPDTVFNPVCARLGIHADRLAVNFPAGLIEGTSAKRLKRIEVSGIHQVEAVFNVLCAPGAVS